MEKVQWHAGGALAVLKGERRRILCQSTPWSGAYPGARLGRPDSGSLDPILDPICAAQGRSSAHVVGQAPPNIAEKPDTSALAATSDNKDRRVHDAAGHEGEQAGDHQRAGKDGDHGVAMPADAVTPRVQDREWQHREREDCEQMDRAPRAPQAQLVNPK